MSARDARNKTDATDAAADGIAPLWLGDVAALAAHELGNAMTVLSFATDALRTRQRAAEDLRRIADMESVVARASDVVRLLARLFAPPGAAVQIDLRQVIAEALPLLERLGKRPLDIALPDAPVSIVAPRTRVERALFEIVHTATEIGGFVGATRLSLEGGPGDRLRIAVEADREGGALCDAAALPNARALAAACEGALTLQELPSGALRIELEVR